MVNRKSLFINWMAYLLTRQTFLFNFCKFNDVSYKKLPCNLLKRNLQAFEEIFGENLGWAVLSTRICRSSMEFSERVTVVSRKLQLLLTSLSFINDVVCSLLSTTWLTDWTYYSKAPSRTYNTFKLSELIKISDIQANPMNICRTDVI